MSDIVETKKSNSKIELSKSEENNSKKNVNENQENNLHKDISGLQDNNIPKKEDNVLTDSDNHIKENKTDVNFEIKDELTDDELINNNEPSNPRNTNSPVTPASRRTSTYYRRASIARAIKFQKEKEIFIQKGKNKLQEKPEKNKIRYLTEEEIDLAFQWFTNGKSVISPEDVKNCFDTFFTGVSKNDKKYYVDGGIKQDTRHLINTREEKIQSEMFNSTQTISSLKKMLLKYPFKMKDYDNAFSVYILYILIIFLYNKYEIISHNKEFIK